MSALPTPPVPLEPPAFALVVAMDQQRGIGRDGDLAWRLPEDLKWFRAVTVGAGGQSVIMGRKTWDSIPDRFRPLPERENWVLTRQPEYAGNHVVEAKNENGNEATRSGTNHDWI